MAMATFNRMQSPQAHSHSGSPPPQRRVSTGLGKGLMATYIQQPPQAHNNSCPTSLPLQGKGLMATYIWQPDAEAEADWLHAAEDLTIIPEAPETEDRTQDAPPAGSTTPRRSPRFMPQGAMQGAVQAAPLLHGPTGPLFARMASGSGASVSASGAQLQLVDTTTPSPSPRGGQSARVTGHRVRFDSSADHDNASSSESRRQDQQSMPLHRLTSAGATEAEARQRRASLPAQPDYLAAGARWRQAASSSHLSSVPRHSRTRRSAAAPRHGLVDVFRAAAAILEHQEQQQQQQGGAPGRSVSGRIRTLRHLPSLARRSEAVLMVDHTAAPSTDGYEGTLDDDTLL